MYEQGGVEGRGRSKAEVANGKRTVCDSEWIAGNHPPTSFHDPQSIPSPKSLQLPLPPPTATGDVSGSECQTDLGFIPQRIFGESLTIQPRASLRVHLPHFYCTAMAVEEVGGGGGSEGRVGGEGRSLRGFCAK